MTKTIAVLAGDGIGPEIMSAAIGILKRTAQVYSHNFEFREGLIGGAAYDVFGKHLPKETLDICSNSEAILLGSVGGPVDQKDSEKWRDCERNSLLGIRKYFKFFVNLRPIFNLLLSFKEKSFFNFLIVRELLGGCYFGKHTLKKTKEGSIARDEIVYSDHEIDRVARTTFNLARLRNKKVTLVDKANVLATSRLWRQIVNDIHDRYFNEILLDYLYIDNAAFQLVTNPQQFDVILTENMFGDILSDLAASLVGSIGLLPSGSLNEDGFSLYEPAGGSAPDIARKNIANPIGQILSSAMMLKYSFNMTKEADAIEGAVSTVLQKGYRTRDIAEPASKILSTSEMGLAIAEHLKNIVK